MRCKLIGLISLPAINADEKSIEQHFVHSCLIEAIKAQLKRFLAVLREYKLTSLEDKKEM